MMQMLDRKPTDEPTNHLDIPSQEILQAVLDEYPGTILLVTHDRYLIDALATQIWEVNPDESELMVFQGTYSQLKEEREKEAARMAALAEEEAVKKGIRPSRSLEAKAERRRIARMQELENQIAELEHHLAELGRQLGNPPEDRRRWQSWAKNTPPCSARWMRSWGSGKGCNFEVVLLWGLSPQRSE